MTINMTIRDLDETTYRKAKSRAAEENKKMGEFITEALELKMAQPKKKSGRAILDLLDHPNDWGIKTDASRIDEYIYQ